MGQKEQDLTDEEIVRLVQSGKVGLFGELAQRYEAKLMRYARKFLNITEDIEDVVQEVFIKAYQNIKSFNTDKKFSPWIYRIAHNEFVNALKKNKKIKIFSWFDLDVFLPHNITKDIADHRNNQEVREIIDKHLNGLELKYREIIILYYFENLSYKEISDVMRIPVSTVGIRLKRGREKLKKLIGNKIN